MFARNRINRDEIFSVAVKHLDRAKQFGVSGWTAEHDKLNQVWMALYGLAEKSKLSKKVEVCIRVETLRLIHERNYIIILKPGMDGRTDGHLRVFLRWKPVEEGLLDCSVVHGLRGGGVFIGELTVVEVNRRAIE